MAGRMHFPLRMWDLDTPAWSRNKGSRRSRTNHWKDSSLSLTGSTKIMTMYGASSKISWTNRNLSSPLWSAGRWQCLVRLHDIKASARQFWRWMQEGTATQELIRHERVDGHYNAGTTEKQPLTDHLGGVICFCYILMTPIIIAVK